MLALIVNTHSSYSDVWPMFFSQLYTYWDPTRWPVYVFSDTPKIDGVVVDVFKPTILVYNNDISYREQYFECLRQVKEPFVITVSEDYIIYGPIDFIALQRYTNVLGSMKELSFIGLSRGVDDPGSSVAENADLFHRPENGTQVYSQTATIWRTRDLLKIYEIGPDHHIADRYPAFEDSANEICKKMGIKGLLAYRGERKRGMVHYDNSVFPYIATALVKGKWNIREYQNELGPLLNDYKIDIMKRGIY